MSIHISFNSDKQKIIELASKKLSSILSKYFIKKIPILLLLSGGSALSFLDQIDKSVLGSHLTIGVLDERYSQNPSNNNFHQIIQTQFYSAAKKADANFIDTQLQEKESQSELQRRFDQALISWRIAHSNGKILITQGIGPDGHTAGILSFPEDEKKFDQLFNNPGVWTVAYNATGKNPYPNRVTTTLTFLKQVDSSICFVCGDEKQAALKRAVQKQGSLSETPAKIINSMSEVWLFTDIQINTSI